MTYTADQFGQWMDDNRLAPADIFKGLGKKEQTIYHWRSRGVPERSRDFVEKFMAEWRDPSAGEAPAPVVSQEDVNALEKQNLVLHPTDEQFDSWTAAFKHSTAANFYQWAMRGLDELAGFKPKIAPYEPVVSDHEFWIDLKGGVAAGQQITTDITEEPMPVAKQYDADCYALRVFGRSMEPKIPDQSLVIVRQWHERGLPRKGTIVVYSDGSGSTLKVLSYRKAKAGEEGDTFGNIPTLKSLNPEFPNVDTMESGRIDAVFVEVV